MNIAVLIKPVLDCGVKLLINEKSMEVDQKDQSPQWIVNPADRAALETALTLKNEISESQVLAVSFTSPKQAWILYCAFARGVDRAILIEDEVEGFKDASYVAVVLGKFLARERIDLILCGTSSLDQNMGCVGPFLAEYLDIPQVTQVVKVDVSPEMMRATVQRRLEKGNREVLACSFPAVFSVDQMISPIKYVSIHALTMAKRKQIEWLSLEFLGINSRNQGRTTFLKLEPPRPRPKRIFVPDSHLSAAERMKLIASGGMAPRKERTILTGSSEHVAEGIFKFLQEKQFLN